MEWLISRGFHHWFIREIEAGRTAFPGLASWCNRLFRKCHIRRVMDNDACGMATSVAHLANAMAQRDAVMRTLRGPQLRRTRVMITMRRSALRYAATRVRLLPQCFRGESEHRENIVRSRQVVQNMR
jgi:hypothetical protein